jgi:hypothetical protein
MPTIGRINEFEPNKESWTHYAERLKHYFAANKIAEDEEKLHVFLTVIGPQAYSTLANLVSPKSPGDESYATLLEKLSHHHSPIPSEIMQRFKFNMRQRQPGESIATFVERHWRRIYEID